MSTAIAMAGAAAPATVPFSSSNAFGASSMQQLPSARLNVRSPAASFHSSRAVAVRACQSSDERRPKVMVALVAAGAALLVSHVAPAHAEWFGSDDVNVERGATAPDFPGNEGTGTKVGNNSGVRGAANSGTPLSEGGNENMTDSGVNLKVPEVGKSVGDAVRRKVEGAKEMAENAKSTVDSTGGLPDAATVASEVVSSEGARDVRDAAGEVAKNAAQSVVTNSAQEVVDGIKSAVPNPLEALISKLTGK